MCGIAGIVSRGHVQPDAVPRLWRSLAHRGPDDRGFFSLRSGEVVRGREWDPVLADSDLLLVHTRLSIIDLSAAGWQPMMSGDGRYVVVFNGEIYNYRELKRELRSLGRHFVSDSDTEVLVEAYAQWGLEALSRFVGMFAVAILDVEERRLLLARDPFGIKPLLYADHPAGFVFASDMRSILEIVPPPHHVSKREVFEYLRFGLTDHSENTLIAGVKHMLPAHYLFIDLDTGKKTGGQYWALDADRRLDVSFAEAVDLVRDAFLRSVELHLRSDVPLGAALSGGIDSSSIVMAMRSIGGEDLDIRTFSFLSEDERDERRWIGLVNAAAGASGHSVAASSTDLRRDLEILIGSQGEPFGSTTIIAQRWVFQLAQAAGMKVMLDGQGADEMFAGYRAFLSARAASLVRQGRLGAAWRFSQNVSKLDDMSQRRLWLMSGDHLLPNVLKASARRLVGREFMPSVLAAGWWDSDGLSIGARDRGRSRYLLRQNLADSLAHGLPMLLRYEDRNSMAFSIESRVPFLTTDLAQLAISLPEEFHISGSGVTKYVLREAMHGIVPSPVLERRDKVGFDTPEASWLQSLRPWIHGLLDSEMARSVAPLDLEAVGQLADQPGTEAGRRDSILWRCVNLLEWSRIFNVTYEV